jgi:O-antigen ligase
MADLITVTRSTPFRLRQAMRSDLGLLVVGGLVLIEALVGLSVDLGLTWYLVAGAVGVLAIFVALTKPRALAYGALAWMLFEKGIGSHFGGLTSTISTLGDGLLLLALAQVTLTNIIRKRWPIVWFGPIGVWLFAFIGLGVASTLVNDTPSKVAVLGILSTIHALIICLALINLGLSTEDVKRIVYVGLVVMSIAGLIGVLQIVPHSPAWALGGEHLRGSGGLLRVDGPFDHPISNGDYLAMVLPLTLSLILFGKLTRTRRIWVVTGAGLMALALLLTFTREAWAAVPFGMLILGFCVERRLLRKFVIYVVPLSVASMLVITPVAERLLETTNGNLRFTLLKLSWPLIRSHLFLGAGPGMFGGHVAYETHTPLYAQYHLSSYFYGTGNQIDMFWTHLVAESGILGTGAFLAMIIACFAAGRRAYRETADPEMRAIILGLLWSAPVVVFVSLFSATLEAGPGATLFWALMGLLVVVSNPTRKTKVAAQAILAENRSWKWS